MSGPMRIRRAGALLAALLMFSVLAHADLPQARAAYESGDYEVALREFTLLAEQANVEAQFRLGTMYANGRGVPRDVEVAAGWFRKAADAGSPSAQINLGIMYEQGSGVPRDYDLAQSWYRKAAEQGAAGAQNALGAMHGTGLGVERNYQTAMSWYLQAADQGHAVAQNNMGFMYLNGQGAAADLVQAYKWFSLAAAAGNAAAKENQPLAAARMTADEIASAERLTQQWYADRKATAPGTPPAPAPQAANASVSRQCKLETADAHPDITWADDVSCVLDGKSNTATIGATEYMKSGLYRFIDECQAQDGSIQRVFEYKNKGRPYLMRLHRSVDPYTYVVIGSYTKGRPDLYHHSVTETAFRRESVKACPTKPAA